MKSYRVGGGAPEEVRQALNTHSDFLQDLLFARGVTTEASAAEFLFPEFERDSHDPFLLPDMEAAVDRVLSAVSTGERVCVWSDYDCDGVPGGVMLTDFLRRIGLTVRHYIPHRHREGYGLNVGGLDELAEEGITLVITIDLGTTEHERVRYAKSKGIDIIVTDHHLVQDVTNLPEAFAIINPKRPDSQYPFDGLCGAGVAWKLVQGILLKNRFTLPLGVEKWYLDLVGIATLSDMVPLVGENRMLARFGLMVVRKNRRPGLSQLLSVLNIKPQSVTEDDIGFMVSPRINAASRMDSPELAARLLGTSDWGEAFELAHKLNAINDERKILVATTVKEVNKRLAQLIDVSSDVPQAPLIVMGNPNWRPGILGLVANSLMQTHGKVVFLWGREGGDVIRGSCRSEGTVSVVELMQTAGDIFGHFGGHTASGGFSVDEDRIHELAGRLTEAYHKLPNKGGGVQEVVVDRYLDLTDVRRVHRELEVLSPFGVGNTKPLFIFQNTSIDSVRTFGKQKNHLELSCARDGLEVKGVAFFSTPESFKKVVKAGDHADVVAHVETDWRGGPRLRIVDML